MSKENIDQAIARMNDYLRRNPITTEQLAAWAEAEEKARCSKCGRMIFCGDLSKICGDPDCGLKKEKL